MNFKIALCISVSLLSAPISAQDVGIAVIKGVVTAGSPGNLKDLKLGQRISHGLTVKTGPGSWAVLRYNDDSRIKLKENTEIVIDAPATKEPSGFQLSLGAVYAAVSKRPQQNFRALTKAAVAGVRGTQFFISYEPKPESASKNTWMCVQEGQVEIHETSHPEAVLVNAGFGVVVEEGISIAPPREYQWTKKLNWNMNPEEGDIVDHVDLNSEYKGKLLRRNYD